MQKISDSTDTADGAGEFTEGNPAGGIPATHIKAMWLNAIQRELLNLLARAGLSPNKADYAQVHEAVVRLAKTSVDFSDLGGKPTTLGGYGIADAYTKVQVNDLLTGKAAKATTLGGYGIADAYTKVQVNDLLTGMAVKATTLAGYGIADAYTRVQVNDLLAAKAAKATTLAGYGITDAASRNSPDFTGEPRVPTPSSLEWGTVAVNAKYVRDKMHGLVHIDVAGSGDYVLTTDQAGKQLIYLVGVLTGDRTIILPSGFNSYTVRNATGGAFKLKVKMAEGVGVEVAQGKIAAVYTDASNTLPCHTDFTALESAIAAKAGLDGPTFTGLPKGPTASAGTNSQQLATTAFVQTSVADRLKVSDVSQQRPRLASPLNTGNWDSTALEIREVQLVGGTDPNEARDEYGPGIAFHWGGKYGGKLHMTAAGALKWEGRTLATIDNPWFTGTPRADTAPGNDDSFQLANTAYVQSSIRGQAPKMAKAWINFWGTSTIGIRNSFNVSSIVDNGVGDYTVNFVTPMANANYAAVTGGALNDSPIAGVNCTKAYARTQTGFKIGTTNTTSGSTDFLFVDAVVFSN